MSNILFVSVRSFVNDLETFQRLTGQRETAYRVLLTSRLQGSLVFFVNKRKQNALHKAALQAGLGVMRILTDTNLMGLDPTAKDIHGDTPNDDFYNSRAIRNHRPPSEAEEKAWLTLMSSTCRQNGINDAFVEEYRTVVEDECNDEDDEEDEDFVDAKEF